MNRRILIALVASLVLLSACSNDPKHKTDHPDKGMISLTTNWDDRTDGVAIPDSYKVSVGDYGASLSGTSNSIDYQFTPGAYDILVYNEVDKISINSAMATVSTVPSGALEPMPGWFFTAHQTLNIEADTKYTVTAPMRQQVRALTLVLTPMGDITEWITRITATLSGVGSMIDMKSGAVTTAANVDLVFEKKASGNYEAVMRLLGVVGGVQKLTSTIEYTGGNPANSIVESDLSALLTNFNSDKKTPLALNANVDVVSGVGFTATITDWKEIEYNFEPNPDLEQDITHHFVDADFREWVYNELGKTEGVDKIFAIDVAGITEIYANNYDIKSFAGIEYFTALTDLGCNRNPLTSIDLSKNTALTSLFCNDTPLEMLDLSQNTALEYLYCNSNQLRKLDVSANKALIELYCYNNQLTSLDVSQNTMLVELNCNTNKLEGLDISNCEVLETLKCDINPGNANKKFLVWLPRNITETTLPVNFPGDLTTWKYPNASGTDVTLNYQFIQDITDKFTDPKFRTYMFQKIGKIEGTDQILIEDVIGVNILNIADLEIKSLAGIEYLSGLMSVDCANNLLTSIDISKNTQLTRLFCSENQIENIDLSNNKLLQVVRLNNNKLTSLDVLANTALEVLYVNNNSISSIDVSKITRLANLQCGSNFLTELDVSKNSWLFSLYCDNNAISTLDLSQHKGLTYLLCNNNKIDKLDISKSDKTLKWLQCHSNAGADDGGVYKFQVDVWTGFDHLTENTFYPNPTNTLPNSGFCGNWQYTPAGGAERTVTVEYKFPVVP